MNRTVRMFLEDYPSDEAILEKVFRLRNYKVCDTCEREANFYKIQGRRAYACQWCGHHIYPFANTIFNKSTTPPQTWLYAIFLSKSNKLGQYFLVDNLGVSNKTGWRIGKKIMELEKSTNGLDDK